MSDPFGIDAAEIACSSGLSRYQSSELAQAVVASSGGANEARLRREAEAIASSSGVCLKGRAEYAHAVFARICAGNIAERWRPSGAEIRAMDDAARASKRGASQK